MQKSDIPVHKIDEICKECKKVIIDSLKLITAGKRKLEEVIKNK